MGARAVEDRRTTEVVGWRRRQLVRAGFAHQLARRVAADPRYDLHELLELVAGGCPPELAVRIAAPTDAEAA